jgi:hypothetical protein
MFTRLYCGVFDLWQSGTSSSKQHKRSRCGFLQDPGVVPLSALRAARSQFRGNPRTLMFALGQ